MVTISFACLSKYKCNGMKLLLSSYIQSHLTNQPKYHINHLYYYVMCDVFEKLNVSVSLNHCCTAHLHYMDITFKVIFQMIQWRGLKGTLKTNQFQLLCHGQGCHATD